MYFNLFEGIQKGLVPDKLKLLIVSETKLTLLYFNILLNSAPSNKIVP